MSTQYEKFNFDTMWGCEERKAFLRAKHNAQVTQDEYVEVVKSFPRKAGGHRANRSRTPSSSRRNYNHLVEKFGFFGGVKNG